MAAAGREAGVPIVLWEIRDPSSPAVRATITIPPEEEIASLAFSPDSSTLYAGGKTKLYSTSVQNIAGLSEKWSTPSRSASPPTEKSLSWLRSIAVSPSGTEMVIAEGKSLFVVELGTFTTKYTLLDKEDGKPIIGVDYSKDGSRFVSSGYDQRILVWSAADGRLIWESTLPTPSCEGGLYFSRRIICAYLRSRSTSVAGAQRNSALEVTDSVISLPQSLLQKST